MITKEYLQQELAKRIDGYKRGVATTTDNIIAEMKSILVLVDALQDRVKDYDDALKRAKDFKNGTVQFALEPGESIVHYIFPELRESEDEEIRQQLLWLCGQWEHNPEGRTIPADISNIRKIRNWLEKQKEQKPILEVFGFKVGDAVRLKDGDGRKHIIKSFEEVEGVHGPNFYYVEFEDNSARDGIYPGEEYPNGYYTQMEKIEEEQKPAEWSYPYGKNETVDRLVSLAECLEMDGDCRFNGYTGTECGKFLRELARKQIECKPAELSEDERTRNEIIAFIEQAIHRGSGTPIPKEKEDKWLAYLEKQKEQKHYWKPTETDTALFNKAVTTNKALTPTERAQLDIIRSKFGYCGAVNCSGIVQKEQNPIQSNIEKEYIRTIKSLIADFLRGKCDIDAGYYQKIYDWLDGRHIESKPIEWNEKDENIRKQLISICDEWLNGEYNARPCLDDVRWLKNLLENQKEQTTVEWNEEDKDYYDTIVRKLEVIGDDSGLSSNQIKFLREHCPLHRSEWSEEDENKIESIKGLITTGRFADTNTIRTIWKLLDSIHPRPSWKPSDEQMEGLKFFLEFHRSQRNVGTVNWREYDAIESLYEDLKKL